MSSSETLLSATRPPFPTYLLPSLSFPSSFIPFRRRHSSTTSVSSVFSANSLSSPVSPISSANTTPSSSPPHTGYFSQRHQSGHSNARSLAIYERPDEEEQEEDIPRQRLGKIQPDVLKCSTCATDLAFASQIVSKGFTGRHGRAYLVSAPPVNTDLKSSRKVLQDHKDMDAAKDLINTKVGRPVNRQLVTGAHVVADISCVVCTSIVGWKYVDAKEPAQRYKIGKFILETRRVVGGKAWEVMGDSSAGIDFDGYEVVANEQRSDTNRVGEEGEISFDSEDEDECEDLFAGVWDAEIVRKRRERTVDNRIKADDT